GRRRRGARAAVEQRDLAEEVAGAEGVDHLASALDPYGTVDDDEEVALVPPLVGQHVAGLDVDLVDDAAQLLELVTRHPGEQRHALQELDLLSHDLTLLDPIER